MSTHNYRIDGKFAPKTYSVRIEQLKRSYNRKLELMRDYLATFSCKDNEALTKENKWLKSDNKRLNKKCEDISKINEQLRDKLRKFAEQDKLDNLF